MRLNWQSLNQLLGRPVRVYAAGTTDPVHYGVLSTVSGDGGSVDLFNLPPGRVSGRLRIEVLAPDYLLSFVTTGEGDWIDPRRLMLAPADRVDMSEPRKHPRAELQLPVWLRVLETECDPVLPDHLPQTAGTPQATTINVSAGGMAIVSAMELSQGTRVLATVSVEEGVLITGLLATVVRSGVGHKGQWLAALRFEHPRADVQAFLSHLVLQQSRAAASHQGYGHVVWPERPDPSA